MLVLFLILGCFFGWLSSVKVEYDREVANLNKLLASDEPTSWPLGYKTVRSDAAVRGAMEFLGASM